GHAEQAFFQKGIAAVPKRESQAESLLRIRNSPDSVLAPAESAGPGMVVREIIPGVAVRTVILAHRSPGPLRQIRSPQMPALVLAIFRDPLLLGIHAADYQSKIENRQSKIPLLPLDCARGLGRDVVADPV